MEWFFLSTAYPSDTYTENLAECTQLKSKSFSACTKYKSPADRQGNKRGYLVGLLKKSSLSDFVMYDTEMYAVMLSTNEKMITARLPVSKLFS